MTMAGKAAEILKYGDDNVSSGPVGDIQQASQMARSMVMRWGMSDLVGNVDYQEAAEGYNGGGGAGGFSVSAATKELIETEVKRIIDEGYDTAYQMLQDYNDEFERLAQGLLEYETLTGNEITKVIAGKPITQDDDEEDDTPPSGKPSLAAIPKMPKNKPPKSDGGLEPEPSS